MLTLDSTGGEIAIAILAAGRGSRFKGNCSKPLALLKGQTLLSHALVAATDSQVGPVMVVLGYNSSEVTSTLSNALGVYNPHWQQGIASSLQAAIQAIESNSSIKALCIGLADQPLIGAEAYRRLAEAYFQGSHFAVATYRGARRNPVLLGRSLWAEAMKLEGDEGARQLMKSNPVVEVPCDDTGNPDDVDTIEELQALQAQLLYNDHFKKSL